MGQKALCLAGFLVLGYFLVNVVMMSAAQETDAASSTTQFPPTTANATRATVSLLNFKHLQSTSRLIYKSFAEFIDSAKDETENAAQSPKTTLVATRLAVRVWSAKPVVASSVENISCVEDSKILPTDR